MSEPIKGTDVIIQFVSGSSYITYGCATDVETTFSMETKDVKTIGDGVWKRKRGQSLSQTISLSGVIKKDSSVPDAFDLLDYLKNMTDVAFKILYSDETGLVQTLKGNALPTEVNLSAGSEGFATGSITLVVNGDPDAVSSGGGGGGGPTPPPDCNAEIETAHTEVIGSPFARRYVVIDSMVAGGATITRWDYSIDGGGTQTAFTSGTIPTQWILPAQYTGGVGSHTIVITPICDNGFSGVPFTLNFP